MSVLCLKLLLTTIVMSKSISTYLQVRFLRTIRSEGLTLYVPGFLEPEDRQQSSAKKHSMPSPPVTPGSFDDPPM
jgi:hypothetical protein